MVRAHSGLFVLTSGTKGLSASEVPGVLNASSLDSGMGAWDTVQQDAPPAFRLCAGGVPMSSMCSHSDCVPTEAQSPVTVETMAHKETGLQPRVTKLRISAKMRNRFTDWSLSKIHLTDDNPDWARDDPVSSCLMPKVARPLAKGRESVRMRLYLNGLG